MLKAAATRLTIFILTILILLVVTACSDSSDVSTDISKTTEEKLSSGFTTNETDSSSEFVHTSSAQTTDVTEQDIINSSTTLSIYNPKITTQTKIINTTAKNPSNPNTNAKPKTTTTVPQPKPTTTTTTKPVFNVQHYVDYAKQYGISIGLIYEPEIGDGNWNAPQNLYASLSDEHMKLNIRSQCDRLKREGCEYFWVYVELVKYQTYKLFIYYG